MWRDGIELLTETTCNFVLHFHHDFRNCIYGDSKCMNHLHPLDFIEGLKELGL